MNKQLELTEKQAQVFDNLHDKLEKYQKEQRGQVELLQEHKRIESELDKLTSAYEDICKSTIIMDDEDAATVSTYRRVLNDLRELYK